MSGAPRILATALAAGLLGGCPLILGGSPWLDEPEPNETAPPDDFSEPPHIINVVLPEWPPVGPETPITALVEDDVGLDSVDFRFGFLFSTWTEASGTFDRVVIRGADLGEGIGTLVVSARDIHGNGARREVSDLLIDLSPPVVEVGTTLLRGDGLGPSGALDVYVGDAYILGSVELTFQESVQTHSFQQGWPPTLGEFWDRAIVSFPADSLPAGSGPAHLLVRDAAGNSVEHFFELTVDASAPVLDITAPQAQAVVSGRFSVSVEASDPEGGECWIDLFLGGAYAASAVGPSAEIELDADDFAPGQVELVAVAEDPAGNSSASAPIAIFIE